MASAARITPSITFTRANRVSMSAKRRSMRDSSPEKALRGIRKLVKETLENMAAFINEPNKALLGASVGRPPEQ